MERFGVISKTQNENCDSILRFADSEVPSHNLKIATRRSDHCRHAARDAAVAETVWSCGPDAGAASRGRETNQCPYVSLHSTSFT